MALVAGPLKRELYFFAASLRFLWIHLLRSEVRKIRKPAEKGEQNYFLPKSFYYFQGVTILFIRGIGVDEARSATKMCVWHPGVFLKSNFAESNTQMLAFWSNKRGPSYRRSWWSRRYRGHLFFQFMVGKRMLFMVEWQIKEMNGGNSFLLCGAREECRRNLTSCS